MQNIFWGLAIIAIGLFMGSSIFFGDFTLFNILFDGAGIIFVGMGVTSMLRQSTG